MWHSLVVEHLTLEQEVPGLIPGSCKQLRRVPNTIPEMASLIFELKWHDLIGPPLKELHWLHIGYHWLPLITHLLPIE